jgi:hypothetical protein
MGKGKIGICAAVALAVLLSACNDVYSERPLFGPADARGEAPLRTGLWAQRDAGCQFDETRPARRWPKCVEWMVVREGQLLDLDARRRAWTAYDYVLASGQPRVLQVALEEPGAKLAYFYLGLDPVRLDPQGRIVEYRQWAAECGPPPPPDPSGKTHRTLTLEPLPGLTPRPDEDHADDCRADGAAAVRGAAKASAGWATSTDWRWVRDGEG